MLIMEASANNSSFASSREKFFLSCILIYSLATGLASMIFMSWAFYVESVLGRGALFIEPNRVLAAGGIFTGATGGVGGFILFFSQLGRGGGVFRFLLPFAKRSHDKAASSPVYPWGA